MTRKAFVFIGFIARHFVASVVSVAPVLAVIVAYIVLFAVAAITNSGIGSPIALPLWTAFVFLASTLYTAVFLFPSVLIAEIACARLGKWQHITQIPISTLALALIVLLVKIGSDLIPNRPSWLDWADYPLYVFAFLLIPLGLYWWVMKAAQVGLTIPVLLARKLRRGLIDSPARIAKSSDA